MLQTLAVYRIPAKENQIVNRRDADETSVF